MTSRRRSSITLSQPCASTTPPSTTEASSTISSTLIRPSKNESPPWKGSQPYSKPDAGPELRATGRDVAAPREVPACAAHRVEPDAPGGRLRDRPRLGDVHRVQRGSVHLPQQVRPASLSAVLHRPRAGGLADGGPAGCCHSP